MAKISLTTKSEEAQKKKKVIQPNTAQVEKTSFFKKFPNTSEKVWVWFKDQAKDLKEAFCIWYKKNPNGSHLEYLEIRSKIQKERFERNGGKPLIVALTPDGCVLPAPSPDEAAQINAEFGLRQV